MTKLRVLVFGGRDYTDAATIDAALSLLDVGCIIHGGARGADTLAGEWGKRKGLPVLRVDAPWDFYGNRAGRVRNQWMLDWAMPTYAAGFPGGTGTRDMAERCAAAGLPLWRPVP
jgi:hypothetical protein